MTGVQTCALPICFPVTISVANEVVQVRIPGPLSFVAGEKVSLEHVGPIRFFAQADSEPAQ